MPAAGRVLAMYGVGNERLQVQKCFDNIHRRSGRATASIEIERQDRNVILELSDDGKSTHAARMHQVTPVCASGTGSRSIRERIRNFGGSLEVTSNGKRTQIRAVIPASAPPFEEDVSGAAG